jgi:hypothetical protein
MHSKGVGMNKRLNPAAAQPLRAPAIQLVGFECGVRVGPPIVHAVAPGEMFGVSLAGAIEMIDEFAEPGRTLLLDLQSALARVAALQPKSPLLHRTADLKTCPTTEQKEQPHEPR